MPFLRFKIIYLNSFFIIIGDISLVSVLISHISHRNRHSIIIGLLLLFHAHQHWHHPLLLNTNDRQAGYCHRGIGSRIQTSQGPPTQSPKIDSVMLSSCLPAAYPFTIGEQLTCIIFFHQLKKQKNKTLISGVTPQLAPLLTSAFADLCGKNSWYLERSIFWLRRRDLESFNSFIQVSCSLFKILTMVRRGAQLLVLPTAAARFDGIGMM